MVAALQAIKDAGLECSFNEEALPSIDRIQGKHISEYLKNNILNDFKAVKEKIMRE